MAVRIRVYPQTGAMGGLGMNGGAVSAQTYFNSKLTAQKQVSNLQLGYERALADERINNVRLEERLKNPYLAQNQGFAGGYGGFGGFGGVPIGVPGLGGFGGLPMGGMPVNQIAGGIPSGFGGGGQSNVTNQTSTGAGTQSVTNSNVNNVSSTQQPYMQGGWGYPQTQFGGGGFLSGLLGALI
jgi:hypothetical protein